MKFKLTPIRPPLIRSFPVVGIPSKPRSPQSPTCKHSSIRVALSLPSLIIVGEPFWDCKKKAGRRRGISPKPPQQSRIVTCRNHPEIWAGDNSSIFRLLALRKSSGAVQVVVLLTVSWTLPLTRLLLPVEVFVLVAAIADHVFWLAVAVSLLLFVLLEMWHLRRCTRSVDRISKVHYRSIWEY